ncbi:unnamed protein product [Ceutorhynchus assimilis]|uniref:Uncharacterized protein n=1 Tax=Ceutorhynchus assimilis TaxID=467358 RepID=A0A9N9QN87_9CUCU|nr:unnamed protein product [Ceutorhynchus assimilis]
MIKEVIILLVGFIALGYAIPVEEEAPVVGSAVVPVADDLESDDLAPAASAWGGGGWGRRYGGWGHRGGYGGGWGGGYGGGWRHRGYGGGWGGGHGGGYWG